MALSNTLKKVASQMIKAQGQSCTYTHEEDNAFDPETGKTQSGTTTFSLNTFVDKFSRDEIDGTNVLKSDLKLIVEAKTDTPEVGDIVYVNGITYRIISVMTVSQAGTAIIYEVQVRL